MKNITKIQSVHRKKLHNFFKKTLILYLLDKSFTSAMACMLEEAKEMPCKELKERMKKHFHKQNISKNDVTKENQK